jgi:trigger factor
LTAAVEDITSTKKRLKIEIPAHTIEKEYREAVDKMRQRAKVPGFRPGKVPLNLIEKRFGDEIKTDVVDRLVPQYYSKALKDAELVPVTLPKFESEVELKRNEPLSFTLTVEVRPAIADLNYTGLKVDDVEVKIEEGEVEDTIKGLQDGRAMYEVVDREIREDDLIVIDYVKLDPTGVKELSSAKDQVMNLGNKIAPKGILEELLGKKKGNIVEIVLPSVDGGEVREDEAAGNRLQITIKEVKEKSLPAIDDELAKDFGHESLASLRERVKEGLLKAKRDKAAGQQKEQLLEKLLQTYDFDVPQSLFDRELEGLLVNEKLSRKKSEELADAPEAGATEDDDDGQLVEELRPKAIKNVKTAILLDMIAEKEDISASEDELRARIGILARHFQTTPENVVNLFVTKDGSLEGLRRTIRDEKVLDFILAKAEVVKGA